MISETILIIGANGQLGSVLTKELQKIHGKKNVIASDIFLDSKFCTDVTKPVHLYNGDRSVQSIPKCSPK